MITSCASDIMLSNVQFSVKIDDDDTIIGYFPGMPENLGINYSRCRM